MSKTVSALVLSAFDDATSGDRFAEGDTVPLERGVFDNFEAAGLVRKADPTVKFEGNTITTTGDIALEGNLTADINDPASVKPTRAAKRTFAGEAKTSDAPKRTARKSPRASK